MSRKVLVQGRAGVTRAASSAALAIWAAKQPELRGRSRPSLDLRSAQGGPLSPQNPWKNSDLRFRAGEHLAEFQAICRWIGVLRGNGRFGTLCGV